MKVCDLISKMPDSYVEIAINEYRGLKHTGRRYIIEKHSTDYTNIPEDVWNAEVNMIVPYFDRISIEIEALNNELKGEINMKNVENYKLAKCIFMEFKDYNNLIIDVTDGLKQVEYEADGIYYEDTDKAEETETYWNEDITETLSKYFGVTVTSIHADDCEIWICYKENQ